MTFPIAAEIPPLPALLVAVSGCALAAVTDWRAHRIPNLLTYPMLVCAGCLALSAGQLPAAFAGLLALGAPAYALAVGAGLGMGDVKLLSALGALLGLAPGLGILALALGFGALLSMAVLLQPRLAPLVGAGEPPSRQGVRGARHLRLPFAVPLLLAQGAYLALALTPVT